MTILLSIVDALVLLVYIIYVPQMVFEGSGSRLLSVCVGLILIGFSLASFSSLYMVQNALAQAIWIVGLLVLATISVRFVHQPAGQP